MDQQAKNNIGKELPPEELLPRFCDGQTTEEESRRVERWIESDASHLKMLEHIHALQLAADTLLARRHTDTEKALKKVKREINRKRISWWEWTRRVAVVLSIPLMIGFFLLYSEVRQQAGMMARMMEVKTSPGMTASVVLPDSTVVYLNSETSLRYPQHFTGEKREVELSGEAFFDVSKDSKRRFIVSMPHRSRIEVHGTSFNVEAYAEERRISTTLVEGSVDFCFAGAGGGEQKVALTPRHKLVYDSANGKTSLQATTCETETAWKEGKLIFKNTPLEEVLRMLGKRYNVEFIVKDLRMDDYAFTGTFTNQHLERILEYFKLSSRIRWKYVDSEEITDRKLRIEIY